MIPNTVALEEYLKPLESVMLDASISEILINCEKCLFVERNGFFERIENPDLDKRHLMGLANLVARYSDQRLSEKEPLLSGQLPTGHRIQVILPPATSQNKIVISIRKQTIQNVSLDDYIALNAFINTKPCFLPSHRQKQPTLVGNKGLLELFHSGNFVEFLKQAVFLKRNIIISLLNYK